MTQVTNQTLESARAEARASTFHPYRLGALVLDRGRIVSRGCNSTKTHPAAAKVGLYCLHAECAAILRANRGDTLVVVRIKRNGQYSCAKPCLKCVKFAKNYGIKRVIYTTWDGGTEEMRL